MLRPFLLSGWISLVLIVALCRRCVRCNGVTFSDRLTAAAGGRRCTWLARGPWTRAAGADRLFGGLGLRCGDGHGRIVITGVHRIGQTGLLDRRFGNLGRGRGLVGLFHAGLARRARLRIAARLLFARLLFAGLLVTRAIATARLLATLPVITLAVALAVTLIVTLAGLVLTIIMVTVLTVVLAIPVMVIAVLAVPISVVGIAAIIVLTVMMRVLALAFGHLALRFTQHAGIVFGML